MEHDVYYCDGLTVTIREISFHIMEPNTLFWAQVFFVFPAKQNRIDLEHFQSSVVIIIILKKTVIYIFLKQCSEIGPCMQWAMYLKNKYSETNDTTYPHREMSSYLQGTFLLSCNSSQKKNRREGGYKLN